ncbi:hypothetical protein [Solibacillus cecembensis]|uniref:hypothetical protein n=1 Tax=Solibacillus cecembensis TaxID=459347 RepID=UPI003D080426
MVLNVLSRIWKSGGVIEREKDGSLKLSNHKNISGDVLKAAEPIFDEIDAWFKRFENMNPVDQSMQKAMLHFCGWQDNEKLEEWLKQDKNSIEIFYQWTIELEKNGWGDKFTDYVEFENKKTNALKKEFFDRATAFAKGAK